MRVLPILTIALLALLSLDPVIAETCTPTTSEPVADTGPTPAGRYYLEWFDQCLGCVMPWVYEESNGIDGLQRADETHDDTCGGMIAGDRIVL